METVEGGIPPYRVKETMVVNGKCISFKTTSKGVRTMAPSMERIRRSTAELPRSIQLSINKFQRYVVNEEVEMKVVKDL